MNDVTLQRITLQAAIAHAKDNARTPKDRRVCAIFYLRCEEKGYVKAKAYERANVIRALTTRASGEKLLTSLLEKLRSEERATNEGQGRPISNTGHTDYELQGTERRIERLSAKDYDALTGYVGGLTDD